MLGSALVVLRRDDWPEDDAFEPVMPPALPAQLADLLRGRTGGEPPVDDLHELQRWMWDLSTGECRFGQAADWRELVAHGRRVVDAQPLVAIIAALTAVGAWYGAEQPTEAPGPRGADVNWGWRDIVLAAIAILERADAFWTARDVADTAVSAIEWSMMRPWSVESLKTLEAVRTRLIALENRYRRELTELAWVIREAVREPGLDRSRLAAALWTAGAPDRAHALADHGYVPALSVIADLADRVLWHRGRDPFLDATWARLWFPGSRLREAEHQHLARRSLSRGSYAKEYRSLDSFFMTVYQHSLFAAFARVIVAWFDGHVSDQERGTIDMALEPCKGHPPSFVRAAALDMLVTQGPEGSQRDWRTIARQAANVALSEHVAGMADPYDRFLDVPLYYLSGADDEVLEQIESQRRAALYFQPLLDERSRDLPPAAHPLIEEQRRTLDEIRALRLVLQYGSDSLPRRLQLRWSMFGPQNPPPDAGWWDEQEAYRRLDQLVDRHAELSDQIDALVHGHARRSRAGASVDDFAAALAPG